MKRLLAVAAVVGLVFAVSAQSAKAEPPSVGMMVYTFTKTTGLYGGQGLVLNTSGGADDINATYGAWYTGKGNSPLSDYNSQTGLTGAKAVDTQSFLDTPVGTLKVGAIAGWKGNTSVYTRDTFLPGIWNGEVEQIPAGTKSWYDKWIASGKTDASYTFLPWTFDPAALPWTMGICDTHAGEMFDWAMVPDLNQNSEDHAKVYRYDTTAQYDGNLWNVSDYYVAFEDKAFTDSSADYDYNDNLIFVRAYTGQVPEPAFVQLAGLMGLAGLGVLRMRRTHRS